MNKQRKMPLPKTAKQAIDAIRYNLVNVRDSALDFFAIIEKSAETAEKSKTISEKSKIDLMLYLNESLIQFSNDMIENWDTKMKMFH